MTKKLIHVNKKYVIAHRHIFNTVEFSAYEADKPYPLNNRLIRKQKGFFDWKNPLLKSEKNYLIGKRLKKVI